MDPILMLLVANCPPQPTLRTWDIWWMAHPSTKPATTPCTKPWSPWSPRTVAVTVKSRHSDTVHDDSADSFGSRARLTSLLPRLAPLLCLFAFKKPQVEQNQTLIVPDHCWIVLHTPSYSVSYC